MRHYPGLPHVAAATWPCTFLLLMLFYDQLQIAVISWSILIIYLCFVYFFSFSSLLFSGHMLTDLLVLTFWAPASWPTLLSTKVILRASSVTKSLIRRLRILEQVLAVQLSATTELPWLQRTHKILCKLSPFVPPTHPVSLPISAPRLPVTWVGECHSYVVRGVAIHNCWRMLSRRSDIDNTSRRRRYVLGVRFPPRNDKYGWWPHLP